MRSYARFAAALLLGAFLSVSLSACLHGRGGHNNHHDNDHHDGHHDGHH